MLTGEKWCVRLQKTDDIVAGVPATVARDVVSIETQAAKAAAAILTAAGYIDVQSVFERLQAEGYLDVDSVDEDGDT